MAEKAERTVGTREHTPARPSEGPQALEGPQTAEAAAMMAVISAAPVDPGGSNSALSRMDSATRARVVNRMQRQYGNTFCQRLLASGAAAGSALAIQRQEAPGQTGTPPPADAPPGSERPTDEFFARAEVENIRARATARYLQLSSYVSTGARVISSVRERLIADNERYREAYGRYAQTVRAARREAQNQQQWLDLFIGIGIGVTLGVASEVILGEAATTAAELAVEVVVEGVEGLAGMAARSVLPQIAGQELDPGSLDPDVLALDVWRAAVRLHDGVLRAARLGDGLFLVNGAAEYCIGEIKAHVSGGSGADMSQDEVLDLVEALVRADGAARSLDEELPAKIAGLTSLQDRILGAPRPSVDRMEQDIWILWIGSIAEGDSNILDLDAIEDRLHQIGVLGPGDSRLGVDFGSWTFEDDELAAIRAARAKSGALREQYGSARNI